MKILKKAILLVLVILIVLVLPISVGAQEIDVNVPVYTKEGDMNKDGKINIKDLVALKQELSKPTDSGGSGDIYFPGHW